jgi:hypothetical protein
MVTNEGIHVRADHGRFIRRRHVASRRDQVASAGITFHLQAGRGYQFNQSGSHVDFPFIHCSITIVRDLRWGMDFHQFHEGLDEIIMFKSLVFHVRSLS